MSRTSPPRESPRSKGEESVQTDDDAPFRRFKTLARRLLHVTRQEVAEEERRNKVADRTSD